MVLLAFLGLGRTSDADASPISGGRRGSPTFGDKVDRLASVAVARSLADKFLIRCLLDDQVRPVYTVENEGMSALKSRLVEVFLSALRMSDDLVGKPDGGRLGRRPSVEAHIFLNEDRLERLRQHVDAAAQEHIRLSSSTPDGKFDHQCLTSDGVHDGEGAELLQRLRGARNLPLALLPQHEEIGAKAADDKQQALRRRGGSDPVARLAGFDMAPLRVPFRRRRQTFACMLGSGLITECFIALLVCLYFWRYTWPAILVYLPWVLLDRSPWKGGVPPSTWMRSHWVWKHWAEYFPASLIKANPDADFAGDRPVMMGYHPHGILSFGAFLNYGTDVTGWAEKFPKLTARLVTLNMNMRFPILRSIIIRMGVIPADAQSIRAALKPGNAVIVVLGGAAEALDTKPGEYVLTLSRRTGFFRLALQHGADVVPTFGFGENDIFDTVTVKGSWLRQLQLRAYKVLSFSMPIFYGRSIFTYNMGLLPYRRPLTVVVGDPIRVEKQENPSEQEVDELKMHYIAKLRELYREWQPRLEPGREDALIIL